MTTRPTSPDARDERCRDRRSKQPSLASDEGCSAPGSGSTGGALPRQRPVSFGRCCCRMAWRIKRSSISMLVRILTPVCKIHTFVCIEQDVGLAVVLQYFVEAAERGPAQQTVRDSGLNSRVSEGSQAVERPE